MATTEAKVQNQEVVAKFPKDLGGMDMAAQRFGDVLVIAYKLGKPVPSSTGKSMVLHTTRGFRQFQGFAISSNIITK